MRRSLVEAIPIGKLLRTRERAREIARVIDFSGWSFVRQRFRFDQVFSPYRIGRNAKVVRSGIDNPLNQIGGLQPPGAAISIDRAVLV